MSASVAVAVLVAAAVLLLPGGSRERLRGLVEEPAPGPRSGRRRPVAGRGRAGAAATDVAAVASELAALTRGGLSTVAAWEAVAPGLGDDPAGRALADAATAAVRGGPVHALLDVGGPARVPLAVLGATFAVQEATGAPVADLLDRAAAGLRADADSDLARRSALAAPLATARVLVVLPPLGLALGLGVGGDPVQVLVSEPAGRWCAVVGALCAAAGWAWSRALVRRAVRPP